MNQIELYPKQGLDFSPKKHEEVIEMRGDTNDDMDKDIDLGDSYNNSSAHKKETSIEKKLEFMEKADIFDFFAAQTGENRLLKKQI